MDFAEMLARAAREDKDTPTISHVGQIARLREFKDRLDAGNPFKIGDVVTSRADSPVKQNGCPHVVVDIRDAEYDWRCDEAGGSNYGAVFDMRVAHMVGDKIFFHWVESVFFEPYVAAVHEKSDAERDYEAA